MLPVVIGDPIGDPNKALADAKNSDIKRLRDLALWHTLSASACRERAKKRKPWNGHMSTADMGEADQHDGFATFLSRLADSLAFQAWHALPLKTIETSAARQLDADPMRSGTNNRLSWEPTPYRPRGKMDCFVDTPHELRKWRGRFLIRDDRMGVRRFRLSFNGEVLDSFNTLDEAQAAAQACVDTDHIGV